MRLTAFTDYGLRALMRLAGDPERVFTTEEVAKEFSISRNYLTKVVQELADAGFVATHRGGGGGFRLAPGRGHLDRRGGPAPEGARRYPTSLGVS
jgi:Rrf2 family nitric oxide-sensitive transcriptional repressor